MFAIHLPPLRERPDDIVPLLEHFMAELGPVVLGRPAAGLSREARERLLAYSWPGNVRELRNTVERALILSEGRLIKLEHVPVPPDAPSVPPLLPVPASEFPPHVLDLVATERALVERALRHAGRNKSKAARLLGLTRTKLYTRLQQFGLAYRGSSALRQARPSPTGDLT